MHTLTLPIKSAVSQCCPVFTWSNDSRTTYSGTTLMECEVSKGTLNKYFHSIRNLPFSVIEYKSPWPQEIGRLVAKLSCEIDSYHSVR